ncbi:CDP-glycerol glycerophosphotransferase family protein [Vibrio sp. Hep-1b-8]|uniref:CDP-glycerol glycerophosphotransferase family protein n=1 Tax=Vibrio sp. Hep-1b-8 TaxID=2144187 RepID=UPI001110088E|nr:CDP-glycerol glycerophosphotransferase family protein [Vibrio sp. Hep-1b-8]TMX34367.1 hypothetical protein DA100_15775 [Vibrio sp. Hep-1b-8]
MSKKRHLLVYFASSYKELYQLYMWEALFEALSEDYQLEVIFRNPVSYYKYNGKFDKKLCLKTSTLYLHIDSINVSACIYVNNTLLNYHMLKYYHFKHLHLGHGESDKSCSKTYHFNAYSDILASGEIAKSRLTSIGISSEKIHIIGKASKSNSLRSIKLFNNERPTILYAPTWEGGTKENRFTSIEEVGIQLVEHYCNSEYNLIFKPHPLIGKKSSNAKKALRTCTKLVNNSDSAYTYTDDIADVLHFSNLLVTDVSSIVIDYLKLNKPYVTFVPEHFKGEAKKIEAINNSSSASTFEEIVLGIETEIRKEPNNENLFNRYVSCDDINLVSNNIKKIIDQ